MRKQLKVIIFFVLLAGLFYWRILFQDKVIFPGDLLVGAYFPWLDYKWGYAVGVPVKNPLISDIFSQFHIWKSIIAESFANGQWPLWNPYSYSGYPLLANFNSGALNPFNLLMILFGDVAGWNYLVAVQTLGSLIAFYFFAKETGVSKQGSVIAAITYAFSGFAITWLPFVNVGYSFIWIALIFFVIEKYLNTKKSRYLYLISPLLFLFITAGHFQAVVFGCLLFGFYFLFRFISCSKKSIRTLVTFVLSVALGLLMSSVQMLPTLELMPLSVRFVEGYIADFGYGLLPKTHILTFFVPDFFGNAATNNYWSVFNYHETVIYVGIFALLSIIGALYYFKKLKHHVFFLCAFLVSLLFIFDTFLGRAIYIHHVPFISTSAAGRISFIMVFCASALSGWWYDQLKNLQIKEALRLYWFGPLIYITIISVSFIIYMLILPSADVAPLELAKAKIAWRNTIFPFGISSLFLLVILVFRKKKLFFWLIIFIVIFDLFRFGWKYLPFVNSEFVYPDTPVTEFIKSDPEIFRVEREKAQVLPPNTWSAYRFASPSGYDPMAPLEYVSFYNIFLNNQPSGYPSRYSELEIYDAETLGELNVKYLLVLKRDEKGYPNSEGNQLSHKVDTKNWLQVFSDGSVIVYKNQLLKPRSYLLNAEGKAKINAYSANKISIEYTAEYSSELVLMDSYYPGWKAYVNGKETTIHRYMDVFRKVDVPKGSGSVVFMYEPESFYQGLQISLLALLSWILIYKSRK